MDERYEWMDTILTELADEMAMEEDFDEEDPFDGLDPDDDDWDDPEEDWDDPYLEMCFDIYAGCYGFDC